MRYVRINNTKFVAVDNDETGYGIIAAWLTVLDKESDPASGPDYRPDPHRVESFLLLRQQDDLPPAVVSRYEAPTDHQNFYIIINPTSSPN